MAERMGGRDGEVPVPGLRVRPSLSVELVPGRTQSRYRASRRVLRRGGVPHGASEGVRPPCREPLHSPAAASAPVALHGRLRHPPHPRVAHLRNQRGNRVVQPRLRIRHAGLDARRDLQQVQCLVQLLQEGGGCPEGTSRMGVPFLGHIQEDESRLPRMDRRIPRLRQPPPCVLLRRKGGEAVHPAMGRVRRADLLCEVDRDARRKGDCVRRRPART